MKRIIYTLITIVIFILGNSSINTCIAQESTTEPNKTQVITANGVRTVDIDKQNKDVSDKLSDLRDKQEKRQQEKRNKRYSSRLIGKIAIGLFILGGAFLWRKFRNKKNS